MVIGFVHDNQMNSIFRDYAFCTNSVKPIRARYDWFTKKTCFFFFDE